MKKSIFLSFMLSIILEGCMMLGMGGMGGMSHNHDHGAMNPEKQSADSNIVRTGAIDLISIDKNNDGKVFQDQMDWNVISDAPGNCPLCKMTLKEVTLETAKKNLLDHNSKTK